MDEGSIPLGNKLKSSSSQFFLELAQAALVLRVYSAFFGMFLIKALIKAKENTFDTNFV